MAERRVVLLAALISVAGGPARAEKEPGDSPEVVAERDALVDRIARGEEYEASLKRFLAMVAARDRVIATTVAAKKRAEEEHDENDRLRREWEDSHEQRLDERCILMPDPRAAVPMVKTDHPADWGKVTRKLVIQLPPRNALDDKKRVVTVYEVAGQARRYVFASPEHAEQTARQGDLVLLCVRPNSWSVDHPNIIAHDVDSLPELGPGQTYPPEWKGLVADIDLLVRITRPPRIADKARWKPVHVFTYEIDFAIRDVKWKLPPDQLVLTTLEVRRDLGGGRFEIEGHRSSDRTWILEAPPQLPRRALLRPHHHVWAILGKPRFDAGLKKLVLEAFDVEERYLFEP